MHLGFSEIHSGHCLSSGDASVQSQLLNGPINSRTTVCGPRQINSVAIKNKVKKIESDS